jgi:hypothetical protein
VCERPIRSAPERLEARGPLARRLDLPGEPVRRSALGLGAGAPTLEGSELGDRVDRSHRAVMIATARAAAIR